MRLERLREWRESRGLTQRELASEADVGEVTVARAEAGISVRPNTAHKMANVMGVAVADLMERPPVPLAEAPPAGRARLSGQEWARELGARRHGMSVEEWKDYVRALDSEGLIAESRKLLDETKMLQAAFSADKWQRPEEKDRRAALSQELRELRAYRYAELAVAARKIEDDETFWKVVQAMAQDRDDVAAV
jgi:transcriptional regulator with XRE-family HTH domain